MSEPKYKVGDEVTIWGGTPCKVVASRCYYDVRKLASNELVGGFMESDLAPYVRPIAVGDRVRWVDSNIGGTVKVVCGDEACYLSDSGNGLVVTKLSNLVRIPTEAAS